MYYCVSFIANWRIDECIDKHVLKFALFIRNNLVLKEINFISRKKYHKMNSVIQARGNEVVLHFF